MNAWNVNRDTGLKRALEFAVHARKECTEEITQVGASSANVDGTKYRRVQQTVMSALLDSTQNMWVPMLVTIVFAKKAHI